MSPGKTTTVELLCKSIIWIRVYSMLCDICKQTGDTLDEIANDPDIELLVTVVRRMRFKRERPESPVKALLLDDVVIVCYSDLEG